MARTVLTAPCSSWRSIGGFALLTLALCIVASGLGGRALWCDEILRIAGQRMSIGQLLRFEHLRAFCTQSPAAYLFMRPWQALLGMETGGFALSALCGALVTACSLRAAHQMLGKRLHPAAALVVSSNPLLIYYGSELAFYSLWAAAAGVAFALLVASCGPPDACGKKPDWKVQVQTS